MKITSVVLIAIALVAQAYCCGMTDGTYQYTVSRATKKLYKHRLSDKSLIGVSDPLPYVACPYYFGEGFGLFVSLENRKLMKINTDTLSVQWQVSWNIAYFMNLFVYGDHVHVVTTNFETNPSSSVIARYRILDGSTNGYLNFGESVAFQGLLQANVVGGASDNMVAVISLYDISKKLKFVGLNEFEVISEISALLSASCTTNKKETLYCLASEINSLPNTITATRYTIEDNALVTKETSTINASDVHEMNFDVEGEFYHAAKRYCRSGCSELFYFKIRYNPIDLSGANAPIIVTNSSSGTSSSSIPFSYGLHNQVIYGKEFNLPQKYLTLNFFNLDTQDLETFCIEGVCPTDIPTSAPGTSSPTTTSTPASDAPSSQSPSTVDPSKLNCWSCQPGYSHWWLLDREAPEDLCACFIDDGSTQKPSTTAAPGNPSNLYGSNQAKSSAAKMVTVSVVVVALIISVAL
jgi:hypothetical protein